MAASDSLRALQGTSPRRTLAGYGAMLLVAGLAFWAIRHRGEQLHTSEPATTAALKSTAAGPHVLAQVLIALAVIVLFSRAVGYLFRRYLGQPPVMGEIVAGIVLGPSVVGAWFPELSALVLGHGAVPHLGVIANLGVVLFMFLVGLELDLRLLRGTSYALLAISHASIVVPFVLGSSLALLLYVGNALPGVSFTVFALFLGISMSVTAFPVLARILSEKKLQHTTLGLMALACAAVDDATAWCLLAFVSGVATADSREPWVVVGMVIAYLLFMYAAARPLARKLALREERRTGPVTATTQAAVLVAVLASAATTELIGIHALFGAFALGTLVPHEGRLADGLRGSLDNLVSVLLLPVFFAFTGLRTQIGLLGSVEDLTLCALVIAVATAGKLGGSFVAARLSGLGNREAAALGVLMNTRGLMELIVLNVGLDMGVLSPRLFAIFVLMAVVTTFATTPVLSFIYRGGTRLPAPPE